MPRKRGAQPGNSNARTHGFYARHLPPNQAAAYREARDLNPAELTDEIALVRARLATLPRARLGLVLAAAKTLAQLVSTHHRLSGQSSEDLGQAVARVVSLVGDIGLPLSIPETEL